MKRFFILLICLPLFTNASETKIKTDTPKIEKNSYHFGLDQMQANGNSTKIIVDKRLKGGKGVSFKYTGSVDSINQQRDADILISLADVKPGRYVFTTHAFTDQKGEALLAKAKTKFESIFITIQVEGQKQTKRVVFAPWEISKQPSISVSGKFEIAKESGHVKLWLPEGIVLESLSLRTYAPPRVPELAETYIPSVVPPRSHPRLWLNTESLPLVKSKLEQGENKPIWEKIKKEAVKPFKLAPPSFGEIPFDEKLERVVQTKAFYYLMTGDEKIGREAVQLTKNYIASVEFGNLLDITREIGRTIYTSSLVYDWCNSLITPDEKKVFVKNFMRLADDMEIGWPPFLQSIVNGHGNEAQVNRDLLSMSIAIFDEDSEPYKYISYMILEQLVPMRKFEYQSPRHNQGINYGSYRFGWDLHAAWLYYRMTGKPVFDDNIKDVHKYWLYMRLPDGEMLRDGDGFGSSQGKPYYWKAPLFTFLAYTYASDPILKADFEMQGGLPQDPILFLLLNDPKLVAEKTRDSLPLTINFGPVLGSMIARTGWDISKNSDDVVAEIKGGGYLFGNHQHSDAGSIQLYYRGLQLGDLGVYKFYGTPYDFNFNKRSVAHSMMLALDPSEVYLPADANDGGTKFNQRFPKTPEEAQNDSWFNNGKVLSADYGPHKLKPYYSYFSADLTAAYGNNKLESYIRDFCFLNLNRKDIPALIILKDKIRVSDPSFKRYWQVNTFNTPVFDKGRIVLRNKCNDLIGKTHINMLLPSAAEQNVEVLTGENANSTFGNVYTPPFLDIQETRGYRLMISPKRQNKEDEFLTVFQVTPEDGEPMPLKVFKTAVSHVVVAGNNIVSMNRLDGLITTKFEIDIPQGKNNQIVLTGLKDGSWKVFYQNKTAEVGVFEVFKSENTIYFEGKKGKYLIMPNF